MSTGTHPHIQVAKREWSSLTRSALTSGETLTSLKLLHQLTSSSWGPKGKLKMLQNSSGGHVTITSSSKRMFNCLSLSKPINKIIVTAAQGHLDAYGDCGLFVASLASLLVLKSVNSSASLRILSEVFELFLKVCVDFLNSSNCPCKVKVPLSSLEAMKVFMRSILESKPLCGLTGNSLDFVQKIILESFLMSVPDTDQASINLRQENVSIVCVEGFDISDSGCFRGLFVTCPELSSFRETNLNIRTVTTINAGKVRVAVVTVSMSGDLEESLKVRHEVKSDVDIDGCALDILSDFCEMLVVDSVGLVVCQKVIHPRLKRELRNHGCVVLDRLGRQPLPFLLEVTGCTPIQSVTSGRELSSYYGYLDSLEHRILYKKSYLHLSRPDTHVSTLFLSHLQEEALQELKEVCSTCLASLRHLLYHPYALTGAGEWQTSLISHLIEKVTSCKETMLQDLEISERLLQSAVQVFTACLQESATGQSGHLHSTRCETEETGGTGHCPDRTNQTAIHEGRRHISRETITDQTSAYRVTDDYSVCDDPDLDPLSQVKVKVNNPSDLVLDSFVANFNGLKTAVLTATTVLRIGQTISDQ